MIPRTVIALRRPEDYSPEEGARFEIHFEKLRNRAEGSGALPFEASIQSVMNGGCETIEWSHQDIKPRLLHQAAELFAEGLTVREVASTLRISKSEAGRLRIRAFSDGLLTGDDVTERNHNIVSKVTVAQLSSSPDIHYNNNHQHQECYGNPTYIR